jgi:hypothetical protein
MRRQQVVFVVVVVVVVVVVTFSAGDSVAKELSVGLV